VAKRVPRTVSRQQCSKVWVEHCDQDNSGAKKSSSSRKSSFSKKFF